LHHETNRLEGIVMTIRKLRTRSIRDQRDLPVQDMFSGAC
jgi:hypothetical protein